MPMLTVVVVIWRHEPMNDGALQAVGRGDAARQALAWPDLVPADWDPMKSWRGRDLARVSDADPRARALLDEMADAWSHAPTRPELEGRAVQLNGYVVPLELGWGGMREFLLVPYAGACIHTPPPPSNQIVHVRAAQAVKGLRAMDVVTVGGTLRIQHLETDQGASGYRLEAVHVAPLP
jgi:hypothetical protein